MGDGTATCGTGLQLVAGVENKGHKLYTHIYFRSLQLFGFFSNIDDSVLWSTTMEMKCMQVSCLNI
jgi:hypothetical protein